ncbi:MAG: ubiquinol-cytochrome c reductase iron-sulfur subunit, partial [Blastocatellia bacterium]
MSDEKPELEPAGPHTSESGKELGRRDFLNEVILGSLGVATIGSLVVTYRYLAPNALFEPSSIFRAGNPDLYPANSVTYIQDQQVYIVRLAQGFYAISAICTHLGCITQWKPEADMIACPCHGSKFKIDGTK